MYSTNVKNLDCNSFLVLSSLKKETSWKASLNSGEILIPKSLTSADTGKVQASIYFTFLFQGEQLNERNLHIICFGIDADKFSNAACFFLAHNSLPLSTQIKIYHLSKSFYTQLLKSQLYVLWLSHVNLDNDLPCQQTLCSLVVEHRALKLKGTRFYSSLKNGISL